MTETTRIHLCGHLRFAVDGVDREGELRGRQGRALFAFLVLHRERPVRRDELVEALWTGTGRPPSDTALAPVLSRLRAALAPGTVAGREQLELRLPGEAWVDTERARAAVARARGATAPAEVLALAREAEALLAPGLLPGLDAPWVDAPRDAVADLRVEALELVARAGTSLDPAAAEEAARTAVALAPFRESARAVLIDVLRARGNVAEALRAFEDVRLLLREELGAAPGPELLARHAALLAAGDAPPAPPRVAAAAAPADLVEREDELAAVDAALAALAGGMGGLVLLEGPAGVGKTRLLGELRTRAAAAGAEVRLARASVLEREYGYGVVRQLLDEPLARDPAALATATPAARAVFADEAGGDVGSANAFAALHGLHRVVAALAAPGRPLVLGVDDLQWGDLPSLRFLAYLAKRVADLPVLVAATVRTGEPAADDAVLAELAQDATALRPAPLTAGATAAVVRARLGAAADDAFAAACHEVTGGNPLLLGQLTSALLAERVPPEAAHADRVRAIGPRAVGRTVLLRLSRLSPDAVAVARAVAVLGEQAAVAEVAALAGLEERAAAEAVGALARADILRAEPPLGFVHPLVHEAVHSELPAAERSLEHARAARLLAERGASAERVAGQLLAVAPAGDPWVVARLREAAALATTRGAPESAIVLLERAQAEPPPVQERASVTLELGSASTFVRGEQAARHLREAHALLTDPRARGEAALALARLSFFLDETEQAPRIAAAALAELPPELTDLRQALEAIEIVAVNFGVAPPSELDRLDPVIAGPRGDGPGARCLTGLAALRVAILSGPAEEASALAREALEGDVLVDYDPVLISVAPLITLSLGDPGEGRAAWRARQVREQRVGSALGPIAPAIWGGLTLIWAGDLADAQRWLEGGREYQRLWGMVMRAEQGYVASFTALVRLLRGDRAGAWEALEWTQVDDGASDGTRFYRQSRAAMLLADGRAREALADLDHLERTGSPELHPQWTPWRALKAAALVQLGERDGARPLVEAELALSRRIGSPWMVGRSLRLVAQHAAGEEAVALAREAVTLLDGAAARLERALAHAALGDALAAEGAAGEAAGAWARALELAQACAADGLAAGLRERRA